MNTCQLPWLEKYRPTRFDEMVGNEETLFRFKAIVAQGNLPNMILAGPPGIGKTTSINCIARELLGEALFKEAVLELNASDDRGIDVVRSKIKQFASKKVTLPTGRHKIVILDEADSMTTGAQQALRRIMEVFADSTRFVLACNISNKIIEPIQSRCAIVRFGKISDDALLERLMTIAKAEDVQTTAEGLAAVVFVADGDARTAINSLQATHAGSGLISAENVYRVCDVPAPGRIEAILECCVQPESVVGHAEKALSGLCAVWNEGYAAVDIVGTFFRVLKHSTKFADHVQLQLMREVGLVHVRVLEGSTSLVQLAGMVGRMCRIK